MRSNEGKLAMRVVPFKRGCVWLGEIPEYVRVIKKDVVTKYPVIRMIESHIEKVVCGVDSSRTAALKIFWATGGQGHWAFLGATFQPHRNSSCIVRVGVSADDSGLTPELAQAVYAQAIKSISEGKSSLAGILSFERAISHPIDSNQKLFSMVTTCLVQILDPRYDLLPDDAISELLEQKRREWYS